MKRLRLKLLAASIASATSVAYAADAVRLDSMVISASGFEQKITDAPASISVVSREDLERKNFSNLAEALQDVEGIDVLGNTGKTGGLNISIRGMPSDYTLILIDGRRQNSAGSITPNGFGEMSTSFIPPVNAIERIEVIRGPMSTLYGSDAIGGVVNIITRKVSNEWTGSVTQEFTIQEESEFGDSRKTSFYTSGPLVEDRLGLTLRGSYFDRDDYKLTAQGVEGQVIELNSRGQSKVDAEIYTIGGRLDLLAHENHDLWFDFDISKQTYDNGTSDNRKLSANDTPTNWRGYADELRHDREQFAIGHTSRVGAGTLESSLMRNKTETIGRTIPGNPNNPSGIPGKDVMDTRELEATNLILDTKYMQAVGERHFLTIGGQYWKAEMIDGVAPNKFSQDDWSLFAENEWAVTDDLLLTLGARYNHNEFFGGHVTPRAYAVYNLDNNWTVKGGVSTGYKTPNVDALYDGINGITAQGQTATVGNPALDPEKSINAELGVYYQMDNGLSANATVFQSRIKDRFNSTSRYNCNYDGSGSDPIQVPAPGDCYNLVGFDGQSTVGWTENLNKARSEGIELAARIPLAPRWDLSVNYTYTDTEIEDGTGQVVGELSDTPNHMANARLNWQATHQANLWLNASYRGESRRFNTTPTSGQNKAIYDAVGDIKGYSLFDLGGSYQLTRNLRFSGTIENLLNKDFRSYKAYEYNGDTYYASEYSHFTNATKGAVLDGRRLWLSANLSF